MARFISGRSKITPQSALSADRYRYLSVSDSEPNLGDPITGPSSYTGSGSIPAGQQYIVVSIEGQPAGERYWIPNQGGVVPGAISIFDEDILVGGLSSTTQIDFRGLAVTAEGVGGATPGIGVTVTIAPPGNPNEVLFVGSSGTDFATDTRFKFTDGLFTAGDRLLVGTGGTIITTAGIGSIGIGSTQPKHKLDVVGDLGLTGTIYDLTNDPGDQGDLLVKGITGVVWSRPNAVVAGAGGTIGQMQYHNAAGLVDGADNVYFDPTNDRVGIGSTQPKKLLDVLGVSTFKGGVFADELSVSGLSTFIGISTFRNILYTKTLNVNGNSTFTSNVSITAGLDVDGTTELDTLYVAENAKFTDATDNTSGNTNTGAVQIDGGVGIDKNLSVGEIIRSKHLRITGIGTIDTFDFGVGQFDNITNLGVSTLGNVVIDGNTIKTKSSTGNLIIDSDGASTVQVNDTLYVNKNTESTNKDTGSIITEGGIGVEKSVNIGENLDVDGRVDAGALNVTGLSTFGSAVDINSTIDVTGRAELDTLNVSVATTTAKLKIGSGVEVTSILDQDNMSSDSATALATQQSIKAYVDDQVTAQDLDFAGDSGTGNVDLDSQTFTISGTTNEIETSASGQKLTIGLPNNVTVAGNLTVNGNADLGNAATDLISIIGDVDTNILPSTDGDLDLGATGSKWGNVYANSFIGAVTGNADTATKLATARNFSIGGDGTAPAVSFDGSANVPLVFTLNNTGVTSATYGSSTKVPQFKVDSKGRITEVTDVNIDFGNANVATADSLTNARSIGATGDISWGVLFKGHENVSAAATLATVFTAGVYGGENNKVLSITADKKGRITGISSVSIDFGNANVATADSLTNTRNIAATGDLLWNVNFKGDSNVSGVSTLKTVGPGTGTYGGENTKVLSLSLDNKGRVTGVTSVSIDFGEAAVATADSLTNSRNIAATGDIAWNVNFKGHENVTSTATLANSGVVAGSYGSATQVGIVTVDSKGRVTEASNVNIQFSDATVATANSLTNAKNIAATGDIAWDVDFKGHENVSAGATLATVVTAGTYGGESTKVLSLDVDKKGRITGVNTVSIDFGIANVATADSLSNSRNIKATGDIAWNVNFKGHENVTSSAVLSNTTVTPGVYGDATKVAQITVDSKGRLTAATDVNINFTDATVGFAETATNLKDGAKGSIPYQDAPGKTLFLEEPGQNNQILTYNNTTDKPEWKPLANIPGGQGTPLTVKDEDTIVGDANAIATLKIVGDQITATGVGSTATITVTDVNVLQTAYTGTNPINVTSGNQIGIGSTSNAYGRRYVQGTQPTDGKVGDVWYDTSGSSSSTITVPVGGIIMWTGTTLPSSNWALCDGSNGTPDLRNRFIMASHNMSKTGTTSQAGPTFNVTTGAVNESGQYAPGDIGGETAHQLTIAELASHTHTFSSTFRGITPQQGADDYIPVDPDDDTNWLETTITGSNTSAGSNNYHENRPPYYALAFIMRIS